MMSGVICSSSMVLGPGPQAFVHDFHPRRDARPAAVLADIKPTRFAHLSGKRGIVDEAFDCIPELRRVALDHNAGARRPYQFGRADIARDDHWQAALHGLERRIAEAFRMPGGNKYAR